MSSTADGKEARVCWASPGVEHFWLTYAPYAGIRYISVQMRPDMTKNTSITLGDDFIAGQVKRGRFGSASEVVRAALRLLENTETRLEKLRQILNEGEQSSITDYGYDAFMTEFNNDKCRHLNKAGMQRNT